MSPSATAVEAVQRGDAGAAAQADLHRRAPRRGKYHSKSNAAGQPRRGLLLISIGEESLPDEPTGGPTPKGTPIGKPSAIGEPPCSLISSRARPYNSSCFFAFTPSPPKQPFDYKALTGEGKVTFSLHLPSPTPHFGEGSEGKKHALLCSIYARENKQKEAIRTHMPHPTRFRKPAFSTSQLNPTTSEVEKTISEVAAPPPPKC